MRDIAPFLVVFSILLLVVTKSIYLINGYSWHKPVRMAIYRFNGFQTSDIARFSIIIYMAYYVDKKREKLEGYPKWSPSCFNYIISGYVINNNST